MKRQNFKYHLAGSISLITFIIYLSSLHNDFVLWDDEYYVLQNAHIRSLDFTFFRWAFFDFYAANWHPVTWISHALDYAIWGLNPMGHHLTNNILHAFNTFVVVLLVVRLIEAAKPFTIHYSSASVATGDSPRRADPPGAGDSPFALIAAATTGLLFGLHPLHVESVAWVAERKDLLCALFYLLSIMAYTRYVTPPVLPLNNGKSEEGSSPEGDIASPHPSYLERGWQGRGNYILSLAFFVLALMSKPMAVSLPLVLLILDWYPFERIRSLKTFGPSFIEKLPFIALSIVSSIVTILAQKAGGSLAMMETIPFSTRVLVAVKSFIAYLWNMIMPINLIPYYPYPKDVSLFSGQYLTPIILTGAITAACILALRREKFWLSFWLYYLITLIPVLGIVQVGSQAMADRYTYLPALGPFLVAGLLAAGVYEKLSASTKREIALRLGSLAVACAVLLPMSYVTLRQIAIWKNGIELWSYVIEREPRKAPFAYINLGAAMKDKGRIDEAAGYYQIAITLDPADANAHNNLGVIFKAKGLYDRAITEFRIALDLKPKFADPHFNLGMLYLDSGARDAARREFEEGLEIRPDDQKARQVLYDIISQQGP
jgi:hypothetical protein